MESFEEIYRTYFTHVYRYILGLSGSEETAEDITAETFLRAMSAMDSFRQDCDIRVWLCQIGKNLYFSRLRAGKHQGELSREALSALPASGPTLEETLLDGADADRIRVLLHSLSQPYQEIFMWRVFGQLSFRQIGALWGKSENWACVTYHRAKKMIQAQMEEYSYGK